MQYVTALEVIEHLSTMVKKQDCLSLQTSSLWIWAKSVLIKALAEAPLLSKAYVCTKE